VNLRTDLAALADLIEVAFADTMDANGRAAIREMRALSHMGGLTALMSANNDLIQGMGMGFVYAHDGKLVGNVSIYPATLPPGGHQWYGTSVWLIANVATHPQYRGQGIARQLMQTSLESIHARNRGKHPLALLQVDEKNQIARRLYERFGFRTERIWTHWRRSSLTRAPSQPADPKVYITQRRRGEWHAEYALALRARPPERGGVGWLRPTFTGMFRPSLVRAFNDFVNLRSVEHLVVRSEHEQLRGALWVESAIAASSLQLTLLVDPDYAGLYDDALIAYAARRFGTRSTLTIEHPADDDVTGALLARYHFQPQRAFANMRWDG
jgi:ribosomal protein S18 acetylase RimI-like enzyme